MSEERLENLASLMDTHIHDGSNSAFIDIFDEDDTQTAIDDNEYMYASVAASDETHLEDDTEHILSGSTLEETIHTVDCPYPGTMRIKYDGKREVANARAVIYVYNIKGNEVDDFSQSLNLNSYDSYSQDVDVRIGYTVEIHLEKDITPAIGYLKNFEVCYDETKDQGISFI